jgi:predicted RNase H-like HicB family nuclease
MCKEKIYWTLKRTSNRMNASLYTCYSEFDTYEEAFHKAKEVVARGHEVYIFKSVQLVRSKEQPVEVIDL